MQQLKLVAKKYAKLFKNATSKSFGTIKHFCKNVTSVIFSNTVRFFKRSPRVLAAVLTIILAFSCITTIVLATGSTTAYAVVYNGETIAMVKEPSVLAEAEIFAANKLNNPTCTSHLIKTSLTQTLAAEKNLINSTELADCIINHSKDIVTATVLVIDDQVVATGKSHNEISNSIDSYLVDYKSLIGTDDVEITNDFKVTDIYTLKTRLAKLPLAKDYLNSAENALVLQTVASVVVEEPIPFKTIETESDAILVGTKKTEQDGVKGIKSVTYKIYSLNGVETERVVESEEVIVEPVDKKVIVGTKRAVVENADTNTSTSMIWPVKRVARSYVSSYVGDGRGHKGMDIVAPAGTPIYAAAGGTVTFAGWDSSGYGYKIIIKHSNGYETLYAHCSALYVTKGDVVVAGENIAAVGTTGRSTGNHLHFEVHRNGALKNPADYIGRK